MTSRHSLAVLPDPWRPWMQAIAICAAWLFLVALAIPRVNPDDRPTVAVLALLPVGWTFLVCMWNRGKWYTNRALIQIGRVAGHNG